MEIKLILVYIKRIYKIEYCVIKLICGRKYSFIGIFLKNFF